MAAVTYFIVSPRIGNPGDPYEPADGVNVEALVEGGFITAEPVSAPKAAAKRTITPETEGN